MSISSWIYSLAHLSSIVLVVISLRSFLFPNPFYIRLFSIYNIMGELAGVVLLITANRKIRMLTSDILIMSEMLAFTLGFFKIIRSRIYRIFLIVVLLFCISTSLRSLLRGGLLTWDISNTRMIFYLAILIGCFIYFVEIFSDRAGKTLLQTYDFWFITGISFYTATSIVYILSLEYFDALKFERTGFYFEIFTNSIFIIVNIIFCKAFLCLKKVHPHQQLQ